MKLKISSSKNSCPLYVLKSYRTPSGKSTSKVVEHLGSLEEVRQRADGRDPMEWAREYVARLSRHLSDGAKVLFPAYANFFVILQSELEH